MDDPQFEDLYAIFAPYPEKLQQVKNWEKDFRKAALKENLYEHAAVKQLVDLLTGYIEANEVKLKIQKRSDYTADNLYFDERTRWEAESNAWKLIISFFTQAKSTVASIGDKVKKTKELNP